MPSPETIRSLFGSIAPNYDAMNSVMTFGMDSGVRKRVAQAIIKHEATDILDLATGSGVLTFAIERAYCKANMRCKIVGLDFCAQLLMVAADKLEKLKRPCPITFIQGNALHTGIPDWSFDAVSVGFGLRNFGSRPDTYAEVLRLLRPGGRFYILETTQPKGIRRFFYNLWLPMIPLIARLFGANPKAYHHLLKSTRAFPDAQQLRNELAEAGFANIEIKPMMLGAVALHIAQKAPQQPTEE